MYPEENGCFYEFVQMFFFKIISYDTKTTRSKNQAKKKRADTLFNKIRRLKSNGTINDTDYPYDDTIVEDGRNNQESGEGTDTQNEYDTDLENNESNDI